MKKLGKILGRLALGVLLMLYVAVALLNYSVVQSYLGAAASHYFSKQWGAEVKVGALHAMPWDHLILNNVLLVDPQGDTVLDVERLRVSFKRFPFRNGGLEVSRVYLKNGYYYFASIAQKDGGRPLTNLQFIIDCYAPPEPPTGDVKPFPITVEALTLNNMHYKMDLPDVRTIVYDHGVEIPHMEFYDIHGRFRDIHVLNDDVKCRIVHLSTTERSGFRVNDISGQVHVSSQEIVAKNLEVQTPLSHILLDASMQYNGWEVMVDYLNTVYHEVTLKEGTTVAMSDAAYWAPVLWGIPLQAEITGTAGGTINDLFADLRVQMGERSGVVLNGRVRDVVKIDSALFDVDIERLWLHPNELQPVAEALGLTRKIQKLIGDVAPLELGGRVRGGMQEHSTANLLFNTNIGGLRLDAKAHPTGRGLAFDVASESDGIDLRPLDNEWVSRTGFSVNASGEWRNLQDWTTMSGELEGELLNLTLRGQHLAPVNITGRLNRGSGKATMQSTDSLARFTLTANYDADDSTDNMAAVLDVDFLDAGALNLLPERFGKVRALAELHLEGIDPDEMRGSLKVSNLTLGQLALDAVNTTLVSHQGIKALQLRSDPMELTASGHFNYEELPLMVRYFCRSVVPSDLLAMDSLTEAELALIEDNTLNYHLYWNDDGRVLQKVADGVRVSKGTRIDGSYNHAELMKVVMRSDSLRFGALGLANIGLSGRATGQDYVVEIESQDFDLGNMPLMQRMQLTLNSNTRRLLAGLQWGEKESSSSGDVMLRLREGLVSVLRPGFTIGETPWLLSIDSLRIDVSNGLRAEGTGIALRSNEQSVDAELHLMQQDNDRVELTFHDFNLDGLTELLLQEVPVSVVGDIDGRFSMYGLNSIPYFNANLTIDGCHVNRQSLGDVQLVSNWNAELNTLNLQLVGDQLNATGWMELGSNNPELDFTVDFDSFELGLVAPLLGEFANRFEGRLHGSFDITGTLSQPLVEGEALVEDGALGVGLTGVTYFFDDSIQFTNHLITFDNFELRDPRGNKATVDGTIHYDDLSHIGLDLRLLTDNILVLDRRQADDFYGTLLASAVGQVGGSLDDLQVTVSARTNAGSRLTVPVSDQRQVKAHNYITFVSDEPVPLVKLESEKQASPLNLEVDLAVTPDLQLSLPMDFSDVKVKVGAIGAGDLHLTMAGNEEPQILGSYEFTSGTMKLGLMSLIEKTFTIESGSSLGFQGSLPDARFDLKAVYSQRVNLSTLTGGSGDLSSSQKYLQVEDVIAIAGTLQEPTIGFDIRLPNADASVEEEVFAYIDRSSERDMLNQSISLLVLGQFYNANTSSLNGNIATSGSISTLSGMLSDMVGVVDINVDYKAANEITKDQLDVNISKDWGRWYLESTLGYGGESRELTTSRINGAVIDALVGYRLSPLVHIFAYNRTNTNDYTRMDLPYKQGVGLKLTKDFDSWAELFGSKKTKRQKGKN